MDSFFLGVFAIAYFAEHLLDLWLTRLNLEHIARREAEVPSYFQESITREEYRKGIAYNREKARLGLVASWTEAPVFWGLLLSGFYGYVDGWARAFGYAPLSQV